MENDGGVVLAEAKSLKGGALRDTIRAEMHQRLMGLAAPYNLKAANGQVILSSEQYEAKAGALNGIEDCFTSPGNAGNGWARRTIASVSASSAE